MSDAGRTDPRAAHRDRWSDDLAAYALDALSEREARRVAEHLAECEPCGAQYEWLAPAVDVIPASVAQLDPPPELRERLLVIVAEEAAPAPAEAKAKVPAGRERNRRRRWLPSFDGIALRPALAGVATFLLLVAGVVGYELRSDSGPDATVYQAASQIPTSKASGTLEVTGDSGMLHAVGLPAASQGDVYQAWVAEPAGSKGKSEIHPSTVFVTSSDGSADVSIPAGLQGAEQVMVTREPEGGSKYPSENPLLTAELR